MSADSPISAPSLDTKNTIPKENTGMFGGFRHRAMLVVLLLLMVVGLTFFLMAADSESTDDAYVNGNIIQVTAQISGTVIGIGADNTDHVTAGMELVRLNPVDEEIQLERAKVALAKATRNARSQFLQVEQQKAEVSQKMTDAAKSNADLARREKLVLHGAVSKEEFNHAGRSSQAANAAVDSARYLLAQRVAMIDGTEVRTHQDVLAAAADLRDAYVARVRTSILAPIDGTVAKRTVQVGQRISAGTALMSIVPLKILWVDANFKESQLQNIRIGQPVALTADVYGPKVTYHGKVLGLEAGTGSAFSLLPAQNATGNWIKVTQRVPVRIVLDAAEVAERPLRLGLSMRATVDTSDRSGLAIRQGVSPGSGYETTVFGQELKDANVLVESVIRANEGSAGAVVRR
ncbi:HlyD family efflux transporter periplasmic adaptor subunit [Achromobacter xylosoxidans]|uniref:HlyD family secretion protein n=1 Tax=Achromobacter TaxID=222 RepID=UPI0008A18965|nr:MULTISPECIES: HlyD family efflux transporter periplasmic adaptor subunit [Achromobacter]MCH4579988.1 HlyD family efflux transporter periplasmic adaptor subunit [Achromobacter xylosoxidans]OFU72928.1 hemolysin D [Achromobacter xylosoxidans]PWY42811.1 EmrA/EmrK family multidrug efflux transporter periplasmic adaptor subunit [Achromobacter sp. RW408]